jgi:hypothetical protein
VAAGVLLISLGLALMARVRVERMMAGFGDQFNHCMSLERGQE